MKHKISIIAGLLISAALLWAAARQVDLRQLAEIFARANVLLLLPIVLTVSAELVLRAIKWRLLLAPAAKVRAWDTLRLETAALALNNILPLRLGELARGAYGADLFSLPIATVFSTILAEKALDLAALLALAGAAAAAGAVPGLGGMRSLPAFAAVLLLAAAAGFAIKSGRLKNWPRLRQAWAQLGLGLQALGRPGSAAALLALAVLQWFFNSLGYYFTARALGLGEAVGLARGAAMAVTGAAASSVPGMPGYFGSVEFAVTTLMKAWGIPAGLSFACAAGAHMAAYLTITAAGLFFIYGMGRSLGQVWAGFAGGKADMTSDMTYKSYKPL